MMRRKRIIIYGFATMFSWLFFSWMGVANATENLLTIETSAKQQQLIKQAKPSLKATVRDKRVAEFALAKANPSVVAEKTGSLEINLTHGLSVVAKKLRVKALEGDISVWYGVLPSERDARVLASPNEIPDDPLNNVTLVRHGQNITGIVRVRGNTYEITPAENGRHLVVKIDPKKVPADTHDGIKGPPLPSQKRVPTGAQPSQSVVTVLIVTTKDVRAADPNLGDKIVLAFQEANRGNTNSKVDIVFENAGTFDADYDEASTLTAMDDKLENSRDPILGKPVNLERAKKSADLVVMLVKNATECGIASIGGGKTLAFAVVNYTCASGSFSFAHEIGHIFGLYHDRASLGMPTNGVPSYKYGFLHKAPPPEWRTIMATYNTCIVCTRINYWSNPDLTYQGHPLGTITYENEARFLNEKREEIANYFPNPSIPPFASAIAQPASAVGSTMVTLDGSATHNVSAGGVLSYEWVQVSGYPALTINNSSQATATVAIPRMAQATTFVFKLIVVNSAGGADSRLVTVSAQPPVPVPKMPAQ